MQVEGNKHITNAYNQLFKRLPEHREMIDNYLYEREVAPVHRQEFDPRIYQE